MRVQCLLTEVKRLSPKIGPLFQIITTLAHRLYYRVVLGRSACHSN